MTQVKAVLRRGTVISTAPSDLTATEKAVRERGGWLSLLCREFAVFIQAQQDVLWEGAIV